MTSAIAHQVVHTCPRLFAHDVGVYPFQCGDGWFERLFELATQLVPLEPPEVDLHANQVKETFECLRFYTRSVLSATSQQRIEEAEVRSFTICEPWGAPGALQHRGAWSRTRCPHHAALDDVSLQALVTLTGITREAR
jgi:hypothetical protein